MEDAPPSAQVNDVDAEEEAEEEAVRVRIVRCEPVFKAVERNKQSLT